MKNKANDHQLKRLLIIEQILFVSTLGDVERTAWRKRRLMLGCRGLKSEVFTTTNQKKG